MMIKFDMNSVSLANPNEASKQLETAQRLLVLVPADTDYTTLIHRIWELANTLGCPILFLSLCVDQGQEASLRRQLITMAAIVQDSKVDAMTRVEVGSNWVEIVRSNLHAGDMIVCFTEQRTGLLHRPLSQILQSNLQAPVYVLSGLDSQNSSRANQRSQIVAWIGSLGIIVGAFLLQIQIISLVKDWAQTAFLILSVGAEIWLIGAWNSLLG
jgi:hypothetical protein